VRDKNCVVGTQPKLEEKVVKKCACIASDFEWCVRFCIGCDTMLTAPMQ